MNTYSYLKKYSLAFLVCFSFFIKQKAYSNPNTTSTYFCGGSYDPDYYYYNMFNQENISQKAFYPFLRTDESAHYSSNTVLPNENVRLWYLYFNKRHSKSSLSEIIYADSKTTKSFNDLNKYGEKERLAQVYLSFAKECEKITLVEGKYDYDWDYDKILKDRKVSAPKLIEKGLLLFEKEKDKQLKLRYGYQLIRLYHYSRENKEAITFFESNIETLDIQNELYYYALDQLGGCYYNLKDYEKAAYLYLKVFDKSIDKKLSAFTSYKFCVYKGAEGKSYLKTDEEKANQIFITAIREFSDTVQDLEKITALGIAEDKQELLFIRILNNIERNIFKDRDIEGKEKLFHYDDEVTVLLKKAQKFLDKKLINTSEKSDFWKLSSSYVSFLNLDIRKAKTKLKEVKSEKYKVQKKSLELVYKVYSWDRITSENEVWMASFFSRDKNTIPVTGLCYDYSINDKKNINCNLFSFLVEKINHLYFKENKIAQAYLLHNNIGFNNLANYSSHKLVDELVVFISKENKSSFEKFLLNGKTKEQLLSTLNNVKGEIYYNEGDFNKALPYFIQSPDKRIPANVFSNNTMECFSCDSLKVMQDEVYKVSAFSFLNKKMSVYDVLINLKKLEDLSRNQEEKKWKRKLAFYLLGNYFFNVSNTGYYRKGYDYYYGFGFDRTYEQAFFEKKKMYNFPNIDYYDKAYHALAEKAKKYYESTIALSSDNELNARCSYMIAKCELNYYYNHSSDNDENWIFGGENEKKFKTNLGFEALKSKYNTTKFYKRIRKACSFFRWYDAN